MASRIDWHIQAPEAPPELPGTQASPRPLPPRRRAGPRFWLSYVAVLGLAAALGFGLGRWSEARAGIQEGLDAALRLEQLAWQRGDREIYEATLSSEADPRWLAKELARFQMDPDFPLPTALRIERLGPDRLRVELAPPQPIDGEAPEIRYYRRQGPRWLREPAPTRP